MPLYPECLGCGVTTAFTCVYCPKCARAITKHRLPPKPLPDVSSWPIEERGDKSGDWEIQCANCEDIKHIDEMECYKRARAGLKVPVWYNHRGKKVFHN